MANIKVTELDFFQIRENLKSFLKSLQTQGKFTDYDFDGSGLSIILDLLAYNTHYNAINANMAINEIFLDTAQRRNNVVSHAKALGYLPRSKSSSFAYIDVNVLNPVGSPASLTIDKGTEFISIVDNKKYTFVNLEAQTITPISGVYKFSNLKINQGVLRTAEYLVDSFDDLQYYMIEDENIDISTLTVKVKQNSSTSNSQVYTIASNYTTLSADTTAYFLQEGVDGKYEIYFGDGVSGKSLSGGNVIQLEWLSTDAALANGASFFSPGSTVAGNSIIDVATIFKAAGGGDRETISSIRFNAPLSYVSQNRVVTADDYKTIILNNYPNIETITVWGGEENDPPQYGKVYISIKPTNAQALTSVEKQFIKDQILKQKNVVSITPELIDPEYTYLTLEAFFKYNPNLTSLTFGELQSAVKQTISDYNTNELQKFDGVYRNSKLLRLIDSTDPSVLNSTVRVYMSKKFEPVFGTIKRYEITFSSPIYNSHGESYIINSHGFYYDGYVQYIENRVLTAGELNPHEDEGGTHVLQMYRIINNTKFVTNTDVGYINATKGIVVLPAFAPTASADGSSTIILHAMPNSNDVAPKRNQLLQILMDQVTVTPEIDTIATGGTNAGINYTTTPRHSDEG